MGNKHETSREKKKKKTNSCLYLCDTSFALTYNTIQYNTIQYNTIQVNHNDNAIHYNAMQYSTMQCNTLQCHAIHHNAMQYTTMQCNTLQCNAIHYTVKKTACKNLTAIDLRTHRVFFGIIPQNIRITQPSFANSEFKLSEKLQTKTY